MKRISNWGCIVAVFLAGMAMAPISALAAGCSTAGCHDGMTEQGVHPGDMECKSCHAAPAGASHPGGGPMRSDGMCTGCHAAVAGFAHPHAPVAAGNCVACHNPHRETVSFLPKDEVALCLSCHADLVGPEMTERHAPIRQGGCRPCHQAHGSSQSRLLVEPFPAEIFVRYDSEAYALCFSCHDRNLLGFPDTSFATGFRDGERNLHYLHVNKQKRGRSCKLCHAVHATTQPKMMAETVGFGNWALPLNFKKSETGGSCSPGCHGQAAYDRNPGAPDQRN
jgi:predicted CXXCH cytochrome family protein